MFDDLGYRRFEWKCNAQNEPSRRAASRFGFTFEGTPDQLGEELTGLGCSVGDGDPVIYECSKGRVDFSVTTVPSAGDEDTTEGRAFMTATH